MENTGLTVKQVLKLISDLDHSNLFVRQWFIFMLMRYKQVWLQKEQLFIRYGPKSYFYTLAFSGQLEFLGGMMMRLITFLHKRFGYKRFKSSGDYPLKF